MPVKLLNNIIYFFIHTYFKKLQQLYSNFSTKKSLTYCQDNQLNYNITQTSQPKDPPSLSTYSTQLQHY